MDTYHSIASSIHPSPLPSTSPIPSPIAPKRKSNKYFNRLFAGLDRWKTWILIIWIALGIVSAIFGPKFFNATTASGGDAPGTPVYEANQVYNENFPQAANTDAFLILVTRTTPQDWPKNDTTVLTPVLQAFTLQVAAACEAYTPAEMFRGIDGYFLDWNTSYVDLASEFVSVDGTSSIITVSYDSSDTNSLDDFIDAFEDLVGDGLTFPEGTSQEIKDQYSVSITGMDLLFEATVDESEHDFLMMDGIVLPMALLVLALYLRNIRMMIIPLASVGLTLLVSFTIMWIIATWAMPVASFAPSIMVSIAIALSIDYSLFLLSRFREEKLKILHASATGVGGVPMNGPLDGETLKRQNYLAVKATLRTAGHVVLVSGTTLMLTFLGLTFFPLPFLQSVGVGSAFALFSCLCVNLILTPVLLLLFPGFFGTFRMLPRFISTRISPVWRRRLEGETNMKFQAEEARRNGNGDAKGEGMEGQLPSSSSAGVLLEQHHILDRSDFSLTHTQTPEELQKKQEASFWFRQARCTTTRKWSVLLILLVLALSLPICFFTLSLQTSSDVALIFPRDAPSLHAFQDLTARFQPGRIDPFHILSVTGSSTGDNGGSGVWNDEFFQEQQGLVFELINKGLVLNTSVTCISYIKSTPISFSRAKEYFDTQSKKYDTPEGYLYRAVFSSYVNVPSNQTAVMDLVTTFNPDGDEAPKWVDAVRGILEQRQQNLTDHGRELSYYLNGGATDDLDSYRRVNSLFPTLIAITVICVFLIVAFLFRSFLIPLRLVFTIGLSISFTYGFAVLVFQKGICNWITADLKTTNTIFWMEPIMTFSILVGLGLDYDVFLFSRVQEYRQLGYTTRASVIKAVYQTGEIITVAGTIMGIAFGGLMSSSTMVLVQFGFTLCFCVLYDTFIVRTLLVPALVTLLGTWNWLPGSKSYPAEQYDVNDFIDAVEEDEADMLSPSPAPAFLEGTNTTLPPELAGTPPVSPTRKSYGSAHSREPSRDYTFLASPTPTAAGQR